ncbi:UNKNOWN [Stylonychia lemnae]|uniref:Uncharacterized protein n=1 Tax=Stylonychia lemnae TaxID=5949 RepID=A0A078AJQ4_STYLE|nr:UNKNOWN [Stylonychia lemnae]|eukprot:CDW82399.1 UNKNOWN [Stylonychia lemnae]
MIGYRGNSLPQSHLDQESIRPRYLSTKIIDKLKQLPRALYPLYALLRILIQIIQLIIVFQSEHYDYVIMQNPPCIPLMLVLAFLKLTRLNNQKVIIDWHNYGYSIMRVNRVNKYIVALAKIYETKLGKLTGDHHLCVSQAMQIDLVNKFNISNTPHVLYDLATVKFQQLNTQQKHQLFKKLNLNNLGEENNENKSLFTEFNTETKKYQYRQDRPALVLSSTSYTPDEDFMVLINALDQLQIKVDDLRNISKSFTFPKIQLVVTGKGPQKDHYVQIFNEKNKTWKDFNIRTAWLEVDDYPKIVASADLGICLHYSSSGLDLPMKVVDMFSAKTPCLAYKYQCIDELVVDQTNGRVFSNEEDLMEQIFDTIKSFEPQNELGGTESLRKYKKNLEEFSNKKWHPEWVKAFQGRIIANELFRDNKDVKQ